MNVGLINIDQDLRKYSNVYLLIHSKMIFYFDAYPFAQLTLNCKRIYFKGTSESQ